MSKILMFAKMQTEGRGTGLDKAAYHDAIEKRARDMRRPGESEAKAYTRIVTETDEGKLLFKALKVAPGKEVKDAEQDYAPRDDPKGPAEQAMEQAVATHRADAAAEGRTLSREQAFTEVYMHPANLGFKQRYDAEMLAKRSAAVAE
jgi:hypothetical protein